jgi:hypothetical protein
MKANELVFTRSMRETRTVLRAWNRRPAAVLGRWTAVSFGIAVAMLLSVLVVGSVAAPDTPASGPNLFHQPEVADTLRVLGRNLLVLALHAFICIAGFMAMRALPAQAELRSGLDRWIHEHAGRFAMVWVAAATVFSITTQVYVLGHGVADLSAAYDLRPVELLATVLPHALPELTAVFLPLAAFLVAHRRGRWDELLAATAVTVAVALPVLVLAATIESYAWPPLLRAFL